MDLQCEALLVPPAGCRVNYSHNMEEQDHVRTLLPVQTLKALYCWKNTWKHLETPAITEGVNPKIIKSGLRDYVVDECKVVSTKPPEKGHECVCLTCWLLEVNVT